MTTEKAENKLLLIDSSSDSVTVTWPADASAKRYVLEYKTADEQASFQVLSNKLKHPQARKRNLDASKEYFFRAGALKTEDDDEEKPIVWHSHEGAFQLLSADQENSRMEAPTAVPAGSNLALLISWKEFKGDAVKGYELQMRQDVGGADWSTIAPCLPGTSVRKKNLTDLKYGYQFRVRPVLTDATTGVFSSPSPAVIARGLSPAVARFFSSLEDGTLLRKGAPAPVPLADAVGGKEFILLYASAHWCPPCRKFTPMLAQWYQQMQRSGAGVEVVFLSADHDRYSFDNYFAASHPWMAVDFDDDAREQLLAAIRVQGIPRLVVMSGISGKILVDNAVGQPLDINQWRALAAKG